MNRSRSVGFTLIELMISLVLTFVVVLFVTQTFTTQKETYTVVDNVAEMQQNLRAITDLFEREIRVAGFLVPEAAVVCGVDNTNTSDILMVSDGDALDPANEIQLGIGAEILGGFVGIGTDVLTVDNVVLDGLPFYDNTADGVADADFRDQAGAIVVDRANSDRGAVCGTVLVIDATTLSVTYESAPLGPAGGGAAAPDLVVIPAHRYTVNFNNQLVRDGMVLADDIEDFQFALFYDLDGDGTEDANEYPGSQFDPIYLSTNWDNSDLREIRVNIAARSASQDPNVLENPQFAQGAFQATENRVAPGGFDGYRRRVMTSRVRPRNVGSRGI